MATNDFKVWAATATPLQAYTPAAYAALGTLGPGVAPGISDPLQANTSWRQATAMASMLGQMIANLTGQNAVDDGTIATLLTNFELACAAAANMNRVMLNLSSGPWVCPAWVTRVKVRAWAGGAGAGGTVGAGSSGSGGGGGEYREGILTVVPGTSYTVGVGAGGPGGAAGGANNGTDGGDTTFGALLTAKGGIHGLGANTAVAASGGAGGSGGSGGQFIVPGAAGGTGNVISGQVFYGCGGYAFGATFGGVGSSNALVNGNAGSGPGAGGSGGLIGGSGGTGSAGLLLIEY